jgi:ribosomal protein S12 methylthiotransferase accessory factor YcaO
MRRGITVGSQGEVTGAIDVAQTFGFPVLDEHPSISPLTSETILEWMDATDLGTNDEVRVPVNFALCPYSGGSQAVIVAGSTNGAACGATREDARVQALREIVERDAFWYYARTGAAPIHLDLTTLPSEFTKAMDGYDGTFTATLLPNPFMAPVANVTFVPQSGFATKSARGSGHASTVVSSVWRALAECVQMLWSLDSGIEVDPVATDMRNLWFSGLAAQAMPNLFATTDAKLSLGQARKHFIEGLTPEDLIASATAEGLTVLDIPLTEENGFAVTKVILSGASVSDAFAFSSCARFEDFAVRMSHSEPRIQYRGSLFM